MNKRLFYWLVKKCGIKHGDILPNSLIFARFILRPVQSIKWILNEGEGYTIYQDCWIIHGIKYDDKMFYELAHSNKWFRIINRDNGILTIETKDEI